MSHEPSRYMTPPVLRPLNAEEHQSLAALLARAERAEARVKELLAELAEQETEKMVLIRELSLAVGSLPVAAR